MARIGIETGLVRLGDFGGGLFGDSLWGCRFFLWGHGVSIFLSFFLFLFLFLGAQGF